MAGHMGMSWRTMLPLANTAPVSVVFVANVIARALPVTTRAAGNPGLKQGYPPCQTTGLTMIMQTGFSPRKRRF